MARSRLQGFAVAHHRLNRVGTQRTSKFLVLALASGKYRDSQVFFSKGAIDLQHHQGTLFGLFKCTMSSMALLPQELSGAQKQDGTLLPAHHIVPLIEQKWQITIALYPFGKA